MMIIMSTIGPALKLLIIGSFLNIVVVTFCQIMFLILIINKYCPSFCRIGLVRNFTTLGLILNQNLIFPRWTPIAILMMYSQTL